MPCRKPQPIPPPARGLGEFLREFSEYGFKCSLKWRKPRVNRMRRFVHVERAIDLDLNAVCALSQIAVPTNQLNTRKGRYKSH